MARRTLNASPRKDRALRISIQVVMRQRCGGFDMVNLTRKDLTQKNCSLHFLALLTKPRRKAVYLF